MARSANWLLFSHTVTGAAMLLLGCSKHEQASAESQPAASPVPVETTVVTQASLEPVIELAGRVSVDPKNEATISAPVEAVVESLVASEGQHVSKGAELVRLDSRPAQAELQREAAATAKARAVLAKLKAGARPEEIDAARQDVQQAQAELNTAEEAYRAKSSLNKPQQIVSTRELNEAKLRLRSAESGRRAAEDRLRVLEKGARPEEIAEAEADVKSEEADEALARLNLDYYAIRSPIDGQVTKIYARVGARLIAGAQVADVLDLRQARVEVSVPATQLGAVEVGGPVELRAVGVPQELSGKVSGLAQRASADTGTVLAWVDVPNEDLFLRRDMVVSARIHLRAIHAQASIPETAIYDSDGQAMVSVVEDGKAKPRPICAGQRVGGMVEVTEGLKAGEVVITSGGYGLPDEQPVVAHTQSRPSSQSPP